MATKVKRNEIDFDVKDRTSFPMLNYSFIFLTALEMADGEVPRYAPILLIVR
jgi:hypothetical protein